MAEVEAEVEVEVEGSSGGVSEECMEGLACSDELEIESSASPRLERVESASPEAESRGVETTMDGGGLDLDLTSDDRGGEGILCITEVEECNARGA